MKPTASRTLCEPRWLRTIMIVHPMVAIVSGLLTIVSLMGKQFEPGAPAPSAAPASGIRLLVTEESPLRGWFSNWTRLGGAIPGIDAAHRAEYAVVVYTFAWDPGNQIGYWYVQPFDVDCHTQIGSGNTWQARVRRGSEYGVLLARLQSPLGTARIQHSVDGPAPGGAAVPAGGCSFAAKLLSFPPAGQGSTAWTYVAAKSKWTPVLYTGLGGLVVAALLLGVRRRHSL